MRVTFVLPGPSFGPVGGFKVVYEFASRLSRRGHEVVVTHPLSEQVHLRPRARFRAHRERARILLSGRHRATWDTVDPAVRMLVPMDSSPHRLPDADAIVATAWQTAPCVAGAPAAKGRKYYLLQGYETWQPGTEEVVSATWRLPLHKLVISEWLEEIAHELGEAERTTRISVGLDLADFGLDEALGSRDAATVGMLLHGHSHKGTGDGLAALAAARERVPRLRCLAFGVGTAPQDLPPWIEYRQLPSRPELRQLLNRCSVFLQPSRTEGWGLPAAESMLCGCALVTTDNGGSREYAVHGSTALVAPVGSPGAMAECLTALILDDDLRQRLALAGREHVQRFSWERATDMLEGALLEPDGEVAAPRRVAV
jgi:glycosyltransferase involved in cell wall biosynthesis